MAWETLVDLGQYLGKAEFGEERECNPNSSSLLNGKYDLHIMCKKT